MKNSILFLLVISLAPFVLQAQVGININGSNPVSSAMLDISSDDRGVLVPRMTITQRIAISSPTIGLLVFENTSNSFWFYNGNIWEELNAQTTPDHIADADNDTYINVETTTDDDLINFFAGGDEQLEINDNTGMTIQPYSNFIGAPVKLTFDSGSGSNIITNTLPIGPESPANNKMNFSINGNNTMTLLGDGGIKINNNYTLPTSNGTSGQALLTDGSGNVSWTNNAGIAFGDTDEDTKIQVEKSSDEDIIRFDIEGSEKLVLKENTAGFLEIQVLNNNRNIFLGKNAGQNAGKFSSLSPSGNSVVGDLAGSNLTSAKTNTFIGNSTGFLSRIGSFNVFVGGDTGYRNTTSNNTMIGYQAGQENKYGYRNTFLGWRAGHDNDKSDNVFLGYFAGALEIGSNKLYIENSNGTPLIYGEFDNDLIQINGTATINGATTINNNTIITGTAITNKLKVGTSGSPGTAILSIIKATISKDVPNISSNNSEWVTFSVTGAEIGSTVSVSPASQLDDKILIAQAYVSSANTVNVNFRNVGNNSFDPPSINYFISIIK